MKRVTAAAFAIAIAALSLAACSDKTQVGSGVNTKFDDKVGQRLGEATTVVTTTTTPGANKTTATTANGASNATTPTTAIKYQEVALSSAGFDTNPIRVYVGTPIRFTNKDTKVRTISGTNGEFDSHDMAPGAQYVFTPHAPASIDVQTDVPFHTTHIDAISR